MSLTPDAIEIHTDKHGCYFAASNYCKNCTVFTLISNRRNYEKDVTDFILKYATWQESDITVLLIDLDTDLNVFITTPLSVQIDPITHDYPHSEPEEKEDLKKRRVFNFFDLVVKTLEQDALLTEKRMRKK